MVAKTEKSCHKAIVQVSDTTMLSMVILPVHKSLQKSGFLPARPRINDKP
jgi:hypothetical protein